MNSGGISWNMRGVLRSNGSLSKFMKEEDSRGYVANGVCDDDV